MKVFAWARKPGWWAPARDLASTAILIVHHPQAMRIDFQLEQGAGRFRSRHDPGPARFTRLPAGIGQAGRADRAELVATFGSGQRTSGDLRLRSGDFPRRPPKGGPWKRFGWG